MITMAMRGKMYFNIIINILVTLRYVCKYVTYVLLTRAVAGGPTVVFRLKS